MYGGINMTNLKPIPHGSDQRVTETLTLPVATSDRPRTVRLAYGRFYADSMTITGNGATLQRGTGYKLVYMDTTSVMKEGLEICLFIQILDAKLNTITVTYRPFGGNAVPNDGTLGDAIAAIDPTKLKTKWSDVRGKPTQFSPSAHEHQWYDLYQMDDFITGLKSIVSGIQGKRIPYYQEAIDRIKAKIDQRVEDIDAVRDRLDHHAGDTNNPHGVTATQLGYGNLPYLPPSVTSALSTDRDHLLQVHHAKDYIYTVKRSEVYDHINRKDNPHQVSADQADTLTTLQVKSLAGHYVDSGTTINNATTLNSKDRAKLRDEFTRQIPVETVSAGVFNPERVGQGGASDTKVLRGDGQYVELSAIFDQYTSKGNRWSVYRFPWNSDYALNDAFRIVTEAYTDRNEWPVGTVVFFSHAQRIWSDTQRMGKALRVIEQIRAAMLKSSGWELL